MEMIKTIKKAPFNLFITFLLFINGLVFTIGIGAHSIYILFKTKKLFKPKYLPGMRGNFEPFFKSIIYFSLFTIIMLTLFFMWFLLFAISKLSIN